MRYIIEGYLDLAYAIVAQALKDAVGVGRLHHRPRDAQAELEWRRAIAKDARAFLRSSWGAWLCEAVGLKPGIILDGLERAVRDKAYAAQLRERVARLSLSRANATGVGAARIRRLAGA